MAHVSEQGGYNNVNVHFSRNRIQEIMTQFILETRSERRTKGDGDAQEDKLLALGKRILSFSMLLCLFSGALLVFVALLAYFTKRPI